MAKNTTRKPVARRNRKNIQPNTRKSKEKSRKILL